MILADLIAALETIAPRHLAEPWDNVGLLVGDPSRPVQGPVMLTIDLTSGVLDEALAAGASVIIAYHPPIFSPLKRIVATSPQASCMLRLIESRIALYSPHTALDNAPAMLSDWLLDQCICDNAPPPHPRAHRCLTPAPNRSNDEVFKIVTFVPSAPTDIVERVRSAMSSAGAGIIGNYERCSFTSVGTGSFIGNAASRPTIGRPGQPETVDEIRLEMICPAPSATSVINALRAAHPYEQPAFDVYRLVAPASMSAGGGRIATLDTPAALTIVAHRLATRLSTSTIDAAPANGPDTSVRCIAAVPGSGAALLDAAINAGADCFVTGEMKHHEVLAALDRGCSVLLAGHTQTERPFLPVLARRLTQAMPALRFIVSTVDRPPLVSLKP